MQCHNDKIIDELAMNALKFLLLTILTLQACAFRATPTLAPVAPTATPAEPTAIPTTSDLGVLAPKATLASPPDFLKQRNSQIAETLKKSIPILLLEGLSDEQKIAQETAIRDERFRNLAFARNGAPTRAEIFQVYPTRESDLTEQTQVCKQSKCYRVEMYNYPFNFTVVGIVDINAKQSLAVGTIPQTQPDIPQHLTDLATQIATNAPEVQQALGFKPGEEQALMASTKTALNKTKCERSQHLCVAPTFVKDDRALWAIVDLTDQQLVGVRWTHVGKTGLAVTERKLQNDILTREFCEKERTLERNGWSMKTIITSSDGLRVSDVSFDKKPILRSIKMVDWHVSYSNTDGFGYSDAVGCPYFSQAAVIAIEPPVVDDLIKDGKPVGFYIEQKFASEGWPTPCNYNYRQRYEFYDDGRFRPMIASVGRGCGTDGIYRPVTRIAFASEGNTFSEWKNGAWSAWTKEQWVLQSAETKYTSEGYQFRVSGENNYFVEPGRGQFGDGGRGDNAWTYVTRHESGRDEGESDLITVGPCCNNDYRQGPEKFIEPSAESIEKSSWVMWYVAQLKNDATPGREYCWADSILVNGVFEPREYPCYSGPMFVPIR